MDPQILAPAHLQPWRHEPLRPAHDRGLRLHDHALTAGAGDFLPPGDALGDARLVGGRDGEVACAAHEFGGGGREAVDDLEVPGVRIRVPRTPLGREHLERGEAHSVESRSWPHVAAVGPGKGLGAFKACGGPAFERGDVDAAGGCVREPGHGRPKPRSGGRPPRARRRP